MNDSKRWQRAQDLFHQAVSLSRPEQLAFLKDGCVGDDSLQADVLAMLEEDQRGESLLDRNLGELAQHVLGNHGQPPPREIGPYQIVGVLGEGGMGIVYLAARPDLGSQVAIKVLRDAWLSPARRGRFAREQQTLAQLNHPSIARLYDADVLPDGTPWFAMEYVEGLELTEYCRRHSSSVEQRLRLFSAVAEAVGYAHGQAVIHRDLKPSNILVKDDGTVRLLDFGIAKELESLDLPAEQTMTGLRLMTPAYASPEQVLGQRVGVGTDVYSLGVVLYELLVGELPFDLSNLTPAEGTTIIAEHEPAKPSAAVKRARMQSPDHGLRALSREAWADLDVLCLTAMHKDPARRYRSVEALIRDVDHYLKGEPLEARPDTVRYRTAKFIRRNRLAVAAGMIFTFGLAAATAASIYQANVARREARRAEQINTFLNDMLGAADPSWYNPLKNKGQTVSLLDVVDQMRDRIGDYFGSDPEVEIRLRRTIGRTYAVLSKHAEARTELQLALEKQLLTARPDDPSLGMLYVDLAGVEYRTQQASEAERDAASAVRILEKARGRRNREALMGAYNYLGVSRSQNGKSFNEQAEPMRRALDIGRELYGNEGPTPVNLGVLATTNLKAGHFDEAEKYLAEAIAISDARPGPKGYEYVALLRDRARLCLEHKNLDCAARGYQAALDFVSPFERGTDSVFTINIREWLALTNGLRGNYGDAERQFQSAEAQIAAIGGSTAESYLAGLNELRGQVHMAAGKFELAEHEFRGSLNFYRQHRQDEVQNAVLASRLGESLARQGKNAEAGSLLRDSYQTILTAMGPDHIWTTDARARAERLH